MNARTYRAPTLALALAEVKADLGAAAVILRTRSLRAGGFLGLGSREVVEITASAQMPDPPTSARTVPARFAPSQTRDDSSREPPRPITTRADFAPRDSRAADSIREELSSIKRLVGQLRSISKPAGGAAATIESGPLPDALFADMVRLREARVPGHLIDQVVRDARGRIGRPRDALACRAAVCEALADLIPTVGELPPVSRQSGRPFTVALIGPTGVGKTTTVAKLAATYRLRRGVSVGLLACDTYRIGAVEQLRAYADIIGLPFAIASSPAELAAAFRQLEACDLVIADTAGRSQNDSGRLSELRDLVHAADIHETHLVLSAAASEDVSLRAIETFGAAGADRLIVTKLDEAESLGVVMGLAQRSAAPISFVTTGQEVPDDIRVARSGALARCIVEASLSALLEVDSDS